MLKISHMVYQCLYGITFHYKKGMWKQKDELEWSKKKTKITSTDENSIFVSFILRIFYNLVSRFFEQQYGHVGKKAWKSTQNNRQKPTGRCKFHKTRCHQGCYQWFAKNLDRVKPTVKFGYIPLVHHKKLRPKKIRRKKLLFPANKYFWLGFHKEKKTGAKKDD